MKTALQKLFHTCPYDEINIGDRTRLVLFERILEIRIINSHRICECVQELDQGLFMIGIQPGVFTVSERKTHLADEDILIFHAKSVVCILSNGLFKGLKAAIVHVGCRECDVSECWCTEFPVVEPVPGDTAKSFISEIIER